MSKQPLEAFPLFQQLPPEVRRAIWQLCRPHRVTEIDFPHRILGPCITIHTFKYSCSGYDTTFLNSRRPIITRVCRESRAVAIEGTGSVAKGYARGYSGGVAENRTRYSWVSEATDIVHLNWTEGWDMDGGWSNASPIPLFTWLAPQFVAASIVDDLIHPFGARLITKDDKEDSDSDSEEYGPPAPILDHLALWKDYFVTIQLVKLHVSFEQVLESGLFGRLGEECIQLVDPFDKDKIHKYFELWQSGPQQDEEPRTFFEKALSTAQFHENVKTWRDEVDTIWLRHKWYCAKETDFAGIEQLNQIWLERKPGENSNCELIEDVFERINGSLEHQRQLYLNRDHSWVKEMLKEMPRFVPRIMFRFCPKKCYDPKEPVIWDSSWRALLGQREIPGFRF